MKKSVYAIVLAAGKSTRMQKQKLLLPFHSETIISKVVKTAMQAVNNNVVVVLGSHSEEVRRQTYNPDLKFILNPNYEKGMLSSVICGFNALPESAGAAMLFLGDQPHIPDTVPEQLIAAWNNSKKGIVIPTFSGKRGHPVLIETKYKQEIEHLNQDKGLKELMEKFSDDVLEVECRTPEVLRDIDTPADYKYEINKYK
jgi:molybdenum cofactor cytidylyltransferase